MCATLVNASRTKKAGGGSHFRGLWCKTLSGMSARKSLLHELEPFCPSRLRTEWRVKIPLSHMECIQMWSSFRQQGRTNVADVSPEDGIVPIIIRQVGGTPQIGGEIDNSSRITSSHLFGIIRCIGRPFVRCAAT